MREERLEKMEEYIRSSSSVSLDQLCDVFGVSKNTVRRDVAQLLQTRGDLKKIYGGVAVQRSAMLPPPFTERLSVNQSVKSRLGALAASYVQDGDIIYVDSGTTTCHIIDHLKEVKDVTVVTNSLEVINRAIPIPGLTVLSLSGKLNRKTLSFTGQSTIEVLEDFNIGKAFMAANGLTVENGATQSTSIEFAIKKMVVGCSKEVVMMLESRKFNVVSLMTYCKLEQIDRIITDALPPEDFQREYALTGGTLVTL